MINPTFSVRFMVASLHSEVIVAGWCCIGFAGL
jgi:hypothetical protein